MTKIKFLKDWRGKAEENLQFIENELVKLTDAQLNFKPDADKWSMLQCVEHLNRYSEYYLKVIDIKLSNANTKGAEEVKRSWFGNMSIKSIHPDNRKKSKTLSRLNPAVSEVNRQVLQDFIAHQKKLLSLMRKAENHPINSIKIPADVFKLLKLRLGECFEFVIVHQQRHILQIKELLYNQ